MWWLNKRGKLSSFVCWSCAHSLCTIFGNWHLFWRAYDPEGKWAFADNCISLDSRAILCIAVGPAPVSGQRYALRCLYQRQESHRSGLYISSEINLIMLAAWGVGRWLLSQSVQMASIRLHPPIPRGTTLNQIDEPSNSLMWSRENAFVLVTTFTDSYSSCTITCCSWSPLLVPSQRFTVTLALDHLLHQPVDF